MLEILQAKLYNPIARKAKENDIPRFPGLLPCPNLAAYVSKSLNRSIARRRHLHIQSDAKDPNAETERKEKKKGHGYNIIIET
jgi:hypothetical protein